MEIRTERQNLFYNRRDTMERASTGRGKLEIEMRDAVGLKMWILVCRDFNKNFFDFSANLNPHRGDGRG